MRACGGHITPVNELAQLSCFAGTLSAAKQKLDQINDVIVNQHLSLHLSQPTHLGT